jgi:hypothetical protein
MDTSDMSRQYQGWRAREHSTVAHQWDRRAADRSAAAADHRRIIGPSFAVSAVRPTSSAT